MENLPQNKAGCGRKTMTEPLHWDESVAQTLIDDLSHLEGATLPILHALQDHFGYVDARAIDMIAASLNLSRAEVFGAMSFYHDFKSEPVVGRIIKFCRAEACQARGGEILAERLEAMARNSDAYPEPVHIETVYCLGNCALGPNALVDGRLIGRLDESRLEELCTGATA